MPQGAYANSDELRAFAQKLQGFAQFVEEQFNGLGNALGRLGDSWTDQEYQHFVEYFQRTNQKLRVFVAETDKVVPQMLRDADILDTVHSGKIG